MESKNRKTNANEPELNMEDLEQATGGTPMSIPGGKRSGRRNSETALEVTKNIGDWLDSFLEDIGLKEKRVNNSIYDRTTRMD